VAGGKLELRPRSETVSEKAVARCILTRKSRSKQSHRRSDFRTALESIGPSSAQFICSPSSDKVATQTEIRRLFLHERFLERDAFPHRYQPLTVDYLTSK
jgi:hypothetical protein